MPPIRLVLGWLLLGCTLCAGAAFAEALDDTKIAVAAFESSGPPDADLPDVATLLADRIGTLGVGRIVGPAELATAANAAPDAATIQQLAASAGVDVIVVGRTTQIGGQLSVDVRLRDGRSGDPVATYVAEVGRTSELATVVDSLATQVVEGSVAQRMAAAPAAPAASVSKPSPRSGSSTRAFDNGKPISIKSKSLEATDVEGRRRLVFTGNVRVTQDDVQMTSSSLTAEYPEGASQPSRMVAKGSVRVTQSGQEVRCDTGTYQRSEATLMCCGNAELRDGPNRVRGSCIEFDLNGKKVRVEDAIINIQPEPAGSSDS